MRAAPAEVQTSREYLNTGKLKVSPCASHKNREEYQTLTQTGCTPRGGRRIPRRNGAMISGKGPSPTRPHGPRPPPTTNFRRPTAQVWLRRRFNHPPRRVHLPARHCALRTSNANLTHPYIALKGCKVSPGSIQEGACDMHVEAFTRTWHGRPPGRRPPVAHRA